MVVILLILILVSLAGLLVGPMELPLWAVIVLIGAGIVVVVALWRALKRFRSGMT